MFNKSNSEKIQSLVERLGRKELSAISDIQERIKELKAEERTLEERLSDIQESYQLLLEGIDLHLGKWKELEELKEKALVIITE